MRSGRVVYPFPVCYACLPNEEARLSETISYTVPGIHCAHCKAAVSEELAGVAGVESVDVDLDSKRVTVSGSELSDEALRAAIAEAGYEAA